MTKQQVFAEVDSLSTSTFDFCKLSYIKEEIERLISLYGTDAEMRETEYPYDGGSYFAICKMREETDLEYTARTFNEARMAANQENRDRTEFERLSQKFASQ